MPTISLEITVNEKGVVTGVQNINSQLNTMGNGAATAGAKAVKATESMSRSTRDAAEMANLLGARFGVAVPAGLTRMMAKFPAVSTGIKGLAGVAGGFIAAFTVMDIVNNLDVLDKKLGQVGATLAEFGERVRGWFTGQKSGTAAERQTIELNKMIKGLTDQQVALENGAAMAGKEGYSQLGEARKQAQQQITRDTNEMLATAARNYGAGTEAYKAAEQVIAGQTKVLRTGAEKQANAEVSALRRKHLDDIRGLEHEAAMVGLGDLSKLRAQMEYDIDQKRLDMQNGVISPGEFGAAAAVINKTEAGREQELQTKVLEDGIQARMAAEASGAQGFEQIELELEAKLQAITMREKHGQISLNDDRVAARKEADDKIAKLAQQNAEETLQIETKAALAMVPPWDRANAEIAASYFEQIRAIAIAETNHLIGNEDAARRTAAAWQEAAGKTLDSWTSAFEELFNGGWSKRIEGMAKSFAARLLAQLTMQSGLSSILGPMLGLPSGMPGGQASMTSNGMTQAGGAALSSMGTLGALGGLGSMVMGGGPGNTVGGVFAGGGATFGQMPMGGAAGASTSSSTTAGAGPTGGANPAFGALGQMIGPLTPTLAKGGVGGGLLSKAGLAGMLPMLAALGGGKIGGTAGMIGGGLLSLFFAEQLGSGSASTALSFLSKPLLGILGGFTGAVLAGVGGGLLGFGVGQQYGKVPGILSGAGMGALTGFMAGGPIGAAIGAIIGLLGGLFGGIFGGSKRRKQAESFATSQLAEIQKVVAAFKAFQIDYPGAVSQLEQMRNDSRTQLGQLKGEGNKVFSNQVNPAIDRALADMGGSQKERERRMGLFVGPPQFATGGWTGSGSSGFPAILHPEEWVVKQGPAAQYRPQLEAMNRGEQPNFSGGGSGPIEAVYMTDGSTYAKVLLRGGLWSAIKEEARRDQRVGR